MTYTPRKDSIAHQVIEHLTTTPGTTLTPADIALKFGKPHAQISSFLHIAVHAGNLKRTINADGALAYSLGEGVPIPNPITPAAAAPYITGQPRTVWVELAQRKKETA